MASAEASLLDCFCSSVGANAYKYAGCAAYVKAVATAFSFKYGLVVAIIAINEMLDLAFKRLIKLERHVSHTVEQRELAIRSFVAKAFNTGLLPVLTLGVLRMFGASAEWLVPHDPGRAVGEEAEPPPLSGTSRSRPCCTRR